MSKAYLANKPQSCLISVKTCMIVISLSNSTKMIIAGKLVRRDDEWLFLQEHSECGARSIEEFVDSY